MRWIVSNIKFQAINLHQKTLNAIYILIKYACKIFKFETNFILSNLFGCNLSHEEDLRCYMKKKIIRNSVFLKQASE